MSAGDETAIIHYFIDLIKFCTTHGVKISKVSDLNNKVQTLLNDKKFVLLPFEELYKCINNFIAKYDNIIDIISENKGNLLTKEERQKLKTELEKALQ